MEIHGAKTGIKNLTGTDLIGHNGPSMAHLWTDTLELNSPLSPGQED